MSKRHTKPQAQPVLKTATPENPKPQVPSAVSVNPDYDAMPDTIEDPAAVYKMAFLDMRHVAINNKLAFLAQEYDRKQAALNVERLNVLNQVKAELREAGQRLKEHKDEMESRYGIALRCYTYNDETGVLTKQALLEEEAKNAEKKDTAAAGGEQQNTLH